MDLSEDHDLNPSQSHWIIPGFYKTPLAIRAHTCPKITASRPWEPRRQPNWRPKSGLINELHTFDSIMYNLCCMNEATERQKIFHRFFLFYRLYLDYWHPTPIFVTHWKLLRVAPLFPSSLQQSVGCLFSFDIQSSQSFLTGKVERQPFMMK